MFAPLLILLAGLVVNLQPQNIHSFNDLKHNAEVAYENSKPLDYSKLNN